MALAYSILVAGLGTRIDEFLVPVFTSQGYKVQSAIGLKSTLASISHSLDLVLIDVPTADELSGLIDVRAACSCALVVVGPARNDKLLVAVLEQGADDYVQRPFRTDELLARIRAQLRRRQRGLREPAIFGHFRIDPAARVATVHEAPLDLSPEEFTLLTILAAQPGYRHPGHYLIEQVWGRAQTGNSALLERVIARLRSLIELIPSAPSLLHGDLSVGYWIDGMTQLRELRAEH